MNVSTHCPECGSVLQSERGLCPACVLGAAISAGQVPALSDEDDFGETQAIGRDDETPRAEGAGDTRQDDDRFDFLRPCATPGRLGMLRHYEIIEVIGRGGMGVVFRAHDPKLDRVVAIKVMKPELARKEAACQRFLREARAVAAIEHENIVTIYQVDEHQGIPFLAMRLLEGASLREHLEGRRVLEVPRVLNIARQIAAGLAAAHERNVIHRDIKPANVWLEPNLRVKILDFGLARALSADPHITRSGEIMGTPAYMAPEQAQGKPVDPRCDLFGLGCVLYQMCTGVLPFQGDDTMSVLMALATSEPAPPRQLNPAVPLALSQFILKLLAKNPADRPESARTAADTLAALERGFDDATATNVSQAKPPARGRARRWPLVAAGLLLALVAVGLLYGGTVVRFALDKGELLIDVKDPTVEVLVKHNGVELHDKKADRKFWLTPGEGEINVYEKDGVGPLLTKKFVLNRGGQTTVAVTMQEVAAAKPPRPEIPKKIDVPIVANSVLTKNATWPRGPSKDALPGVIPFPAKLPGIERWQVLEKSRAIHSQLGRWSPDGRWLAARLADFDRTYQVRLYEAGSNRLARILCTDQGNLHMLEWSPDSQWLCVAQYGQVRLFRPDGTAGPEFRLTARSQLRLHWSSDSKQLLGFPVQPDRNRYVTLMNAETGKQVDLYHSATITDAQWSPDGKWIATTSTDKTARLWRRDGSAGPVLAKHTDSVTAVVWHPASTMLATSSADGSVRLWKTDGGAGPVLDHLKETISDLLWSGDGKYIVTGTQKATEAGAKCGDLRLWDSSGKLLRTYAGDYRLSSVDDVLEAKDWSGLKNWRPDNKGFLAYQRNRQNSNHYDVISLPIADAPARLVTDMPGELTWSPDGRRLIVWGEPSRMGFLHLLRLENGDFTRLPIELVIGFEFGRPSSVSWSPDSKQVLVGMAVERVLSRGDCALQVFHASGKLAAILTAPPVLRSLAISPRGDRFAIGEQRGRIRVLQMDGAALRSWTVPVEKDERVQRPRESVADLSWHPDGRHLASCDYGQVYVWDTQTEALAASTKVPEYHERDAYAAFQPTDGSVLAISGDQKGALWNWQQHPTPEKWFDNFSNGPITWSPDGRRFAAPHRRKLARIWTADLTLESALALPFYVSIVNTPLAWNPAGTQLLVGSMSESLRIVDNKGSLVKLLGSGIAVAWSADGKHLASAAGDAHVGVQLWTPAGKAGPTLEAANWLMRHPASVALAFSPDSQKLLAGAGNHVAVWHTATGKLDRLIILLPAGNVAVLSPAGELLFVSPSAEGELVYVVEQKAGRLDTLTSAAFQKLVRAQAP